MKKVKEKKVKLTREEKRAARRDISEAVGTAVKAARFFKVVMEIAGGILGVAALGIFVYAMVTMLKSCENILH